MRFIIATAIVTLLCYTSLSAQESSNAVRMLCHWNDTAAVRPNMRGQRYSDVWGFVANGREYAVIGATNGAHIIDLNTCTRIAYAPGTSDTMYVTHRDYKTYSHYLYAVCDQAGGRLQVYDTRSLPDSLPLVYTSTEEDFDAPHKIFIDTTSARLYACNIGYDWMLDPLRIYSLENPERPTLLSRVQNIPMVHDMFVRNDTVYASCQFDGYYVVDCRNPTAPKVVGGLLSYPYQGYNHSCWINDAGIGVMTDETYGLPMKVIDTRDVTDIQVLATFSPVPDDTNAVAHSPFLVGDLAYISHYKEGLQIYDLADPRNPKRVGWYDTYPGGPGIRAMTGAWGCYPFFPSRRVAISDMISGLWIFDVDEASGIARSADVRIYPNPARDAVFILPPKAGAVECVIMDMAGRVVTKVASDGAGAPFVPVSIPLPANMPTGLYALRAAGPWGSTTRTFLKQ